MKKILLLSLLSIGIFSININAQNGLLKKALNSMGDAQYIKDFNANLTKGSTAKFSIILNSRSQYKFNVANSDSNAEKITMKLMDGTKELASNENAGKMYDSFEFICQKSKVYSLVFSFKGGDKGDATAVLSLVKQFKAGEKF